MITMHQVHEVAFRLGVPPNCITVELEFDFEPDEEELFECLKHWLLDQKFDQDISLVFLDAAKKLDGIPKTNTSVNVKTEVSPTGFASTMFDGWIRVLHFTRLFFKKEK